MDGMRRRREGEEVTEWDDWDGLDRRWATGWLALGCWAAGVLRCWGGIRQHTRLVHRTVVYRSKGGDVWFR